MTLSTCAAVLRPAAIHTQQHRGDLLPVPECGRTSVSLSTLLLSSGSCVCVSDTSRDTPRTRVHHLEVIHFLAYSCPQVTLATAFKSHNQLFFHEATFLHEQWKRGDRKDVWNACLVKQDRGVHRNIFCYNESFVGKTKSVFKANTPPHSSFLPLSLSVPLSLFLFPCLSHAGTLTRWAWLQNAATRQSRTGALTASLRQWWASTWLNPTAPPRPPNTTRYGYAPLPPLNHRLWLMLMLRLASWCCLFL